jgi:D-alanyl-D-alanine carboxypeptidase
MLVPHRFRRLCWALPTVLIVTILALIVDVGGNRSVAAAADKTKKPAPKSSKRGKPGIASLSQNRSKQAAVRQKKVAAAGKLKQLQSDERQVSQTLAALTDDLSSQNAALGSAKRALAAAETEVSQAKIDVNETTQAITKLSGARQVAAMDAYVDPPVKRLNAILNTKDLSEASKSQVYIEIGNRGRADALDELNALEQDNAIALTKAKKAEAKRNARRKAAALRLANLRAAQARTEKYANLVSDQQDEVQSELEGLATIDATLAKQISQQQRAYDLQLAKARRNGMKGGVGSAGQRLPDIPTGSTHGIVVAASIRGKLAALLAAADRDGIYLSGGGYRSSSAQLAVRRRNCGSSSYAIYQMPSSSCSPPTAKPGRSQHERGLAIDFTQNGRALRRNTSGYQWLRAHAAAYGFYNLPSEAWHWSTTGR